MRRCITQPSPDAAEPQPQDERCQNRCEEGTWSIVNGTGRYARIHGGGTWKGIQHIFNRSLDPALFAERSLLMRGL